VRPIEINLPSLSPEASEWDRQLYPALWDQFRLNMTRIEALERTLGTIAGHGAWIKRNVSVQTLTTYTVLPDDYYMIGFNAAAITYTLPDATLSAGRELRFRSLLNAVNSASANVGPLAGGASGTAILAAVAGKWALLVSNGVRWNIEAAN
jgi:hypothetical protein